MFLRRAVMEFTVVGNSLLCFFGSDIVLEINSWLTLYAPGLLLFSGLFMTMRFFSGSVSVHCSLIISPMRSAVSLAISRATPRFLPAPLITVSMSRSSGICGSLPPGLYLGFCQWIPTVLAKAS